MRVLFITGEFPPMQGGVGDCTNEIARALTALQADVGVLTSTQAAVDTAIRHLPFAIFPIIKKWNWSSLRVISKAVRDFSPDFVHIQFQTAAFEMHPSIYFLPRYLSYQARLAHSPYPSAQMEERAVRLVVTFHDLRPPYLFPKAGSVRDWVTRELARSSDAVIATNEQDYAKLDMWNVRQLSLIPIGSNISATPPPNFQREAWRAQLGVTVNETLICYFGFLNESKGGETLVRALALVPDAKLLMIGGQTGASDQTNAAYLARVKILVSELGLSNRVIWTGFTPPEIVTGNFLSADLCVQPYREGGSFRHGTLMAALAHGMPIVTTRILPQSSSYSPLRERERGAGLGVGLEDGVNCLLVPPNDPQALAGAIQRAAASPDLLARIGAGARALAQNFTWDKIAQQHLNLYHRMLPNDTTS